MGSTWYIEHLIRFCSPQNGSCASAICYHLVLISHVTIQNCVKYQMTMIVMRGRNTSQTFKYY